MRELKVMTLGRQLSLVHSSKNSSASFQSPAFSQALIRLLYVITLRSQPWMQQPRSMPRNCHRVPCPIPPTKCHQAHLDPLLTMTWVENPGASRTICS